MYQVVVESECVLLNCSQGLAREEQLPTVLVHEQMVGAASSMASINSSGPPLRCCIAWPSSRRGPFVVESLGSEFAPSRSSCMVVLKRGKGRHGRREAGSSVARGEDEGIGCGEAEEHVPHRSVHD